MSTNVSRHLRASATFMAETHRPRVILLSAVVALGRHLLLKLATPREKCHCAEPQRNTSSGTDTLMLRMHAIEHPYSDLHD